MACTTLALVLCVSDCVEHCPETAVTEKGFFAVHRIPYLEPQLEPTRQAVGVFLVRFKAGTGWIAFALGQDVEFCS